MRGRYIVLEGGERVGKGTQCDLLVEGINHLSKESFQAGAHYIREPGGTEEGEFLRKLVKDEKLPFTPLQQALLHNAARIIMLAMVVKPLLDQGVWVVSDRCYLSTIVYQGYGQGADMAELRQLTSRARALVEPDVIIVLDALPERMLMRRDDRGSGDRYDNLNLEFHNTIREAYLKEANYGALHPVVNADDEVDEVAGQIWKIIREQSGR